MAEVYTINIVANNNPRTVIKYIGNNFEIAVNSFFTYTILPIVFADTEANSFPKIAASGGNKQPLPSWLQYNPQNRTVFGYASTVGAFNIDFTFTDDGGLRTYFNIRVRVDGKVTGSKFPPYLYQGLVTASITLGIGIMFIYMHHFNITYLEEHEKRLLR